MLSDLGRNLQSPDAAATALADFVRRYPFASRRAADGWEILLPHRPPLAWPGRRGLGQTLKFGAATQLYEPVATAVLDFAIERGDVRTFFDIGASFGYFAFVASARDDTAIETHAFDMMPSYVEATRQLAERHGLSRIRVNLSGLSDEYRGEKDIWFSRTRMFEAEPRWEEYRDSFFVRLKMRLRGKADRSRPVHARVTIDTIDHYCETGGVTPDVIKIDVDGYEAKVLPGGLATFAAQRPVILLELHRTKLIGRFATSRAEIVRPLFDLGYSCLFMTAHNDPARNEIRPVGPDDPLVMREETDFLVFL